MVNNTSHMIQIGGRIISMQEVQAAKDLGLPVITFKASPLRKEQPRLKGRSITRS